MYIAICIKEKQKSCNYPNPIWTVQILLSSFPTGYNRTKWTSMGTYFILRTSSESAISGKILSTINMQKTDYSM